MLVKIQIPRPCSHKFSFAESENKVRESAIKPSHCWFWYHWPETHTGRTLLAPWEALSDWPKQGSLWWTHGEKESTLKYIQAWKSGSWLLIVPVHWGRGELLVPLSLHSNLGGPWSLEGRKWEDKKWEGDHPLFLGQHCWLCHAGKYLASTSLLFKQHTNAPM